MSTMNMKPNRIALFLAKILGKPEGENIKPSNATEYYLNELAETGGGLPKATAEDAGNVLTVDSNGDPEWSAPSGGGVVVTITGTAQGKNDPVYSCDMTYAEIVAAAEAGSIISCRYVVIQNDALSHFYTGVIEVEVKGSVSCAFLTNAGGTRTTVHFLTIDSSNTITYRAVSYTGT